MKNIFKKFHTDNLGYSSFRGEKPNYTRTISPKLGYLGVLGVLGFLGFLPQIINVNGFMPVPFPFFFFGFFGFFGFYYEGKMSNTLIDERFRANAYRAEAVANKIAILIILLVSIIFVPQAKDAQIALSVLIATIAVAFGLSVFLQQYLLYRFENEE